MHYKLENEVVTCDCEHVKLFQPINPSTGKQFISKAEQVEWAEQTLNGLFKTVKATLSFTNANNQIIKNLYTDKPYKATFSIDITDTVSVKGKMVYMADGSEEEIQLDFVDGKASFDITFAVDGEYYFILHEPLYVFPPPMKTVDGEIPSPEPIPVHILHELYEFKRFVAKQ